MAITDYASLGSSLSDWLNSNGYSGKASEFIQMAEAHFNRVLRHPKMEVTATSVIAAGDASVALPDDFLEARTVFLDDDPDKVLTAMSPMNLRFSYPYASGGVMAAYAISGSLIELAPAATAAGTLSLAYYAKIPSLESNSTNWLLTDHPDLYLRAARFYAYDYQRDDAAADRELAKVEGILESINQSGNKMRVPAGPLQMKSTVRE